jgi:hypothetical protein
MALTKADIWRKQAFTEDSVPCLQTVVRWYKKGKVNGRIIEKTLFIDATNPFPEQDEKGEVKKFVPTLSID